MSAFGQPARAPMPTSPTQKIVGKPFAPDQPGYLLPAEGFVAPHELPEKTDHVLGIDYHTSDVGHMLYIVLMQRASRREKKNFEPTDAVINAFLGGPLKEHEARKVNWRMTWKRDDKGRAVAVKIEEWKDEPVNKKKTTPTASALDRAKQQIEVGLDPEMVEEALAETLGLQPVIAPLSMPASVAPVLVRRKKTTAQAQTATLIGQIRKIVRENGLSRADATIFMANIGDPVRFSHSPTEREFYLAQITTAVQAAKQPADAPQPATPATPPPEPENKPIAPSISPAPTTPSTAAASVAQAIAPNGKRHIFADPMSQAYLKWCKNLAVQAGVFGWPAHDLTTLELKALGSRARDYAGTETQAYEVLNTCLKTWKDWRDSQKPKTELDDFLDRDCSGQPREDVPVTDKLTEPTQPAVDETPATPKPWKQDEKQLKKFWVHANGKKGRHSATRTMNLKQWEECVHALLEVESLEEIDTEEEAEQRFDAGYDEIYPLEDKPVELSPKELADGLFADFFPAFKALRPDVTDKAEAAKLIVSVLGFPSMIEAVTAHGVDVVRKLWDENKAKLALPPEPQTPIAPASSSVESGTKPPSGNGANATTALTTTVQSSAPTFASPALAELEARRQTAIILIKSGLLPKSVDTPEKVIVISMMGEALGIPQIVALNGINVIAGKPTVSPQLMLGLVRRRKLLESFSWTDDGETSTVKMKRPGEPEHVETFSMDDARKLMTTEWENNNKRTIPLADKKNWREQPKTMRKWRAVAAACRVVFPDVTLGIASYTAEEINPDIEIENAGEIVDEAA